MRIKAFACACLCIVPVYAQQSADIEYAEIMPHAPRSLLLDIVAVSGGGFVAVGERGHVVYSDDGNDWKQATVVPTRSTLTAVTEYGGRLWAGGHDTVLLTSGDGGVTWTRQYFDPERQQAIMDLRFFSADRGIAVGAYGLALYTEDGGANWEDGSVNEEEWHNNAILSVGEDQVMVAGEAGFAYRSRDGGESWETLELPYAGSMFGLVLGFNDCIALFGLRGHVQETCDFGDSWEELPSNAQSSISGGVHFQDKTVLVGNSGIILVREGDGPLKPELHSSGADFAAIAATGDGRFLLVGEEGIHHFPEQGADAQ